MNFINETKKQVEEMIKNLYKELAWLDDPTNPQYIETMKLYNEGKLEYVGLTKLLGIK